MDVAPARVGDIKLDVNGWLQDYGRTFLQIAIAEPKPMGEEGGCLGRLTFPLVGRVDDARNGLRRFTFLLHVSHRVVSS